MRITSWVFALGLSMGLVSTSHAVDDAFWLDVENNRAKSVLNYLAQGVDPNSKSREELPAVMWAIQNQSWAVYDLLIAHRQFDPNVVNANNETPLMYLAILGEDQKAEQLIAKGAQVQRLGWTPLHYAASKGHLSTAQLLLKHGALVNAPAPDGSTALMMAARSGSRPMVDLLLQRGADPTVRSLNQLTAADWAEANQNTRLASQLRELAQRYDHSRPNGIGLIEDTPPSGGRVPVPIASSPSTDSDTTKYFDLKRFE